jgi:hypothetical protein
MMDNCQTHFLKHYIKISSLPRLFIRLFIATSLALFTSPLPAQKLVINELSICNISGELDPEGDFRGWIELYNTTGDTLNLKSFVYSDDPALPAKYRLLNDRKISPGGFACVWVNDEVYNKEGRYLDTDPDGGYFCVAERSGILIDEVSYPAQYTNISWGRTTDNGNTFAYFLSATHEASNNNSPTGTHRVAATDFSLPGGFYDGPIELALSCPTPGAAIHYTLDGSNPSPSKPLYTGTAIRLDKTTPLRAQAFLNGFLTGPVSGTTFLINERQPSLPVVLLTMDTTYLYDSIIGIYTVGVNGIPGAGGSPPANYNQDWTRPAHFDYLGTDKKPLINQLVGIEINGNATRLFPQKSFKVKASKRFGYNKLNADFFGEKPHMRHKSILLRAGGQDWKYGGIRDGFLQQMTHGLNLDHQAWSPVVAYINGQYWGYMFVRERHNSDFLYANYGWDELEVDIIENNWREQVSDGDMLHYNLMKNYILSADMTQDSCYRRVCTYIDMDSYLNYMAVELFVTNEDWPRNNQKLFRNRADGRWRWIVQDLDKGYQHPEKNLLGEFFASTYTDFSLRMILYLLQNPTFKERYIDTQCLVAGSVFHPDRANSLLDKQQAMLDEEYLIHAGRWDIAHQYRNEFHYSINLHKQRTLAFRESAYRNLRTNFQLDTAHYLSIKASHPADLSFNGLDIPFLPYEGRYFDNRPLSLKAPQYTADKTFQYWLVKQKNEAPRQLTDREITLIVSDSTRVEAVYFSAETARRDGLYLNEISASNSTFADQAFKTEDWVELHNTGLSPVDLSAYYLSNSASDSTMFPLTGGSEALVPPKGHYVLWCSNESLRGPNHANFKLPKEGGQLFLFKQEAGGMVLIDSLSYPPAGGQTTFGRYPDGADDLCVLNNPTIGGRNLPSSYNKLVYTQQAVMLGLPPAPQLASTRVQTFVTPNLEQLHVVNESGRDIRLYAFTADGRQVIRCSLPEGHHILPLQKGWHPLFVWYY